MIQKKNERRTVKSTEVDKQFKYLISKAPGGEKLLSCIQCGTCTSDCPVARFSDGYRPRQIIRMAQLGLKKRIIASEALWLCASCFTCTGHCPQNVEVADIVRVLRNFAAQQGHIPRVFKELGSSILESGYAYRIPELRVKKREALGLPPLPKCTTANLSKTLSNVHFQKLLKKGEMEHGRK